MSLSFPGEFPGKDRTDFVVGPVASPDSVPRDTAFPLPCAIRESW